MAVSVFRCGRCGKRFANPRTHTCVVRMGHRRKPGRTRIAPQASVTCSRCGKPYANPLTHTCTVRTDFRQRQRAAARTRQRAATAQERARKRADARTRAAAARQRQRAATRAAVDRAVARERQRAAARANKGGTAPKPRTRPARGGRPADNHDYRECFYASQPDRGRAAQVCDRFPCRIYREGHQHGLADGHAAGYAVGYAKGYDDGYAKGYPDGIAACPRPHGNG
jgi:hypothetical protein